MPAPVLQFKRGNAGVAGTVPALHPGEPAISLNNFDFFIGIDTSVANNKFFGSHRYWTREDGTNSLKLNLVDKGGTNKISIKSPDTLVGTGTYTLPDTNTIVDGYFLKVATDGSLSWETVTGGATFTNSTLTGVTTVTGTLDATGAEVNAGIVTVTDLYIDSTRVLYDDGSGITLAGIQTIDATTKTTLETILAFAPNDFDSLNVSGIATVGGLLDANGGLDVLGHSELDTLNVSGVSTFTGAIDANGGANISGGETILSSATVSDLTSGRVVLAGTSGALEDSANLTFNGTALTIGTGVGVTQFSGSVSTGTSTSSVPTSKAVIDYVGSQVGNVDLTLGIDADTGGPSTVNTSQTLTLAGTLNEVNTSVSGQTITVGLPDSVTITTALTTPTVNATNVKANDGTTAITITNATGAVETAGNLTIGGDLFVNGSTTQVNTQSLTVEDRTIELGMVDGAAPTAGTTWDLGVLFNYYTDAAKKSALVWEHAAGRFQLGSIVTDGGGTGNNNPQVTVSTFAPIEIGELWVNNTCTGGAQQVISCVGSVLQLQNITLDAGFF